MPCSSVACGRLREPRTSRSPDSSSNAWHVLNGRPRPTANERAALIAYNRVPNVWFATLELVNEKDIDETWASLDSALPTSSLLPPIYFQSKDGISGWYAYARQVPGQSHAPMPKQSGAQYFSHFRGVARLTTDDPPQVRWTLMFREDEQDKWRFEAVQPCGRGSMRGMFGIWSKIRKDTSERLSPHGPFWFWRLDPRGRYRGYSTNPEDEYDDQPWMYDMDLHEDDIIDYDQYFDHEW